ncbi:PTB domain-containing engulfment adapter protein 1-like isoform X2 [Xenia sp. Carnegie-2017]|uniref:PTB domain-containing engulfment adapter protein 1-like isoform X2 n=1 Tax=Xenia sp. Carnegie-2017 TaxID=2897299 RepID=UPI001F04207D|nr:PTB domain-containing engulfment adapter protein 1-like isoform X2 [Xenia sp. Carnegie-2017]
MEKAMQRGKTSKKKSEQPEIKWRHTSVAVEKGKVTYSCKFWGYQAVSQSKGSEMIKETIKKLQFANDMKKSEEGLKASKLKKVELCISIDNLILTETKTKTTLYNFPLERVSYCSDDKATKKLFGFIARNKESSQHHCYILESDKNAEELTLAVGQAFTLAYKRFKENQAVAGNDVNEMKERVETAEKENEVLRKKLEELEKINKEQATNTRPSLASIAKPRVNENNQQTFDPFAEKTAPVFESSSFDIQSPSPFPTEHRPLPPSIASNPFEMSAAESHAAQSHKNDGDLLGVYGSKGSLTGVSSNDVNNMFDPLAEIDNNSEVSQSEQNAVDQNEHIYATVSRPKPAPLSTGLLPPPPSKQSIMEKNRNSGNKEWRAK